MLFSCLLRTTTAVFSIVLLAACGTRAQPNPSPTQTLQEAANAWELALAERDPERVASFFAEDIIALYPHPMPTIGWEANRAAWVRVFQTPTRMHPVRIDEVFTSPHAEIGYTFGTWWNTDPATNADSGGRFLAVWRPIGGTWKMVRLSANSHEDIRWNSAPSR
jgi:ketosteroid isomerase-like protein